MRLNSNFVKPSDTEQKHQLVKLDNEKVESFIPFSADDQMLKSFNKKLEKQKYRYKKLKRKLESNDDKATLLSRISNQNGFQKYNTSENIEDDDIYKYATPNIPRRFLKRKYEQQDDEDDAIPVKSKKPNSSNDNSSFSSIIVNNFAGFAARAVVVPIGLLLFNKIRNKLFKSTQDNNDNNFTNNYYNNFLEVDKNVELLDIFK